MTDIFFGASHAFFMAQCAGTFSGGWNDVMNGPLPVLDPQGGTVGHLALASPRARLFLDDGRQYTSIEPGYAGQLATLDVEGNRAFLLLGGNEHNSLFMHRHAVPFDFFDAQVDQPLLKDRQVVPAQVVREALRKALVPTAQQLRLAAESLSRTRRAVIAPPPPIPSEDHILGAPEVFDFASRPLEDRWVRLKVHRLYVELLAGLCDELALPLVTAPAGTVDEHGFLAPGFFNLATHAQPAFYRSILE